MMITGMRVFPAVNHAASSTLLPTLLTPHNKYAIIYLRAAGGWEAGRKHQTVKPHIHTLLCWSLFYTQKHTHYMLAQGHIKLSLPVFLTECVCAVFMCTNVCACVKSYSLINRAGIQTEQTLVILFFIFFSPWQHIYTVSYSDNVIGSWLFFWVDQMTSPLFSSSL